jgi:carboxyl-terminal processing protease
MKKTLLWISILLATASQAASPVLPAQNVLAPIKPQYQATAMTAEFLSRYHYKPMAIDDAMSHKMFDRYLKSLDGDKLFFTQKDIDQFNYARTKLDDALLTQDLTIPFALFNLYRQRAQERMQYARDLLKEKFDFSVKDEYVYAREKVPFPKDEAEMQSIWKQRVKNDSLRLRLAGKDDAFIRTTLEKRYDSTINRLKKIKSEDVFQLFLDSYATTIEPHTNYLGPKAAEDFDMSMKLSMSGIGAVIQERDEVTVVREIVAGSPAANSGKLKVGDRIVGVAQGKDAPMVDVMGWRSDDVVRLIRGPKGTTVVLDVLPADVGPDAPHVLISIVRDKITMEQQAAKKSIIEIKNGEVTRRIGVISLPTFYQDFEARRRGEKDFKSASRDVAKLLKELKAEKVDSVLMDLRNNGGGSLNEAVELTGLFTGKGPVVQQRTSQGRIQVESEMQNNVIWDGPMAVMINRSSASASEIFAAAIQDYGRGLVLGESSFGKGTVQTLISLDQMARSEKAQFGELKMTVAQFFRINGGTTQLRGVTPDITFPSFSDGDSFGESSYENALPWTQIKPAEYQHLGNVKDMVGMLQMRHEMRIAKDQEFIFLKDDIAEYKQMKLKKAISLNEAERKAERDLRDKKVKEREELRSKLIGTTSKSNKVAVERLNQQDDGLQANERSLSAEIAEEKASKEAKDIFLTEAANILSDEIDLLKSSRKIAEQVITKAKSKVTLKDKVVVP